MAPLTEMPKLQEAIENCNRGCSKARQQGHIDTARRALNGGTLQIHLDAISISLKGNANASNMAMLICLLECLRENCAAFLASSEEVYEAVQSALEKYPVCSTDDSCSVCGEGLRLLAQMRPSVAELHSEKLTKRLQQIAHSGGGKMSATAIYLLCRRSAGAAAPILAPKIGALLHLCADEISPLHRLLVTLLQKKSILLAGPPGSGKTFMAKKLAAALTHCEKAADVKQELLPSSTVDRETLPLGKWVLVQMHPSYSYADFVSGVRPSVDTAGFAMVPGVLLRVLAAASAEPTANFVLVIDELNRANVPAVLGELFGLLGSSDLNDSSRISWRDADALEKAVLVAPEQLPGNLYIIATMNTSDQSILALDAALCRRFARFDLVPTVDDGEGMYDERHSLLMPYANENSVLKAALEASSELTVTDELCMLLDAVNNKLRPSDRIGHSHFLFCNSNTDVRLAWQHSVEPYLDDVCQGEETRRKAIRQIVTAKCTFLEHTDARPPAGVLKELQQMEQELSLDVPSLQTWHTLLLDKKALLMAGPPGCGKTFAAKRLARLVAGDRVVCIAFHPEFSYEEFVQGQRPGSGGGLSLEPGALLRAAETARRDLDNKHVLVIDEFNRANLAEVVGECYNLLQDRDVAVTLRSGDSFSLPPNLYIIVMMNTADRSVGSLDVALRRRFATVVFDLTQHPFCKMLPCILDKSGLSKDTRTRVKTFFDDVHADGKHTPPLLPREGQIGISTFCAAAALCQGADKKDEAFRVALHDKWKQEVEPYVQIQVMGDERTAQKICELWNKMIQM